MDVCSAESRTGALSCVTPRHWRRSWKNSTLAGRILRPARRDTLQHVSACATTLRRVGSRNRRSSLYTSTVAGR